MEIFAEFRILELVRFERSLCYFMEMRKKMLINLNKCAPIEIEISINNPMPQVVAGVYVVWTYFCSKNI